VDNAVRIYIDDDEGYSLWLNANSHGYVVNTERGLSGRYLKLHRASCGQLHRRDERQAIMTGEYVKVCATPIAQLEKWLHWALRDHPRLDPCRQCNPD
jgi:hypothetical protein